MIMISTSTSSTAFPCAARSGECIPGKGILMACAHTWKGGEGSENIMILE